MPPTLLHELWHGPAKWVIPVLLGWALSAGIVITPLTDITQDYFASAYPRLINERGAAGVHVGLCPSMPSAEDATVCKAAASAVVGVSSYMDAFGSLVVFAVSAGVGRLSDEYGRRPFLLVSFVLPQLGHAALAVYFSSVVRRWALYVDLWVYLAIKTVALALPLSMTLAYFADAFSAHNRAGGFGIVLCCFSGAIIVGPKLGARLPTEVALWLAVAVGSSGLLIGALFLPETLSAERRAAARAAARATPSRCGGCGFVESMLILTRDRFFLVLAAVAAADGAAVQGMQDISLFFLKETLGAGVDFRSTLMQAVGFGGLVIQGLLLRPMVERLGERGMLLLGLAATAGFIAAYAALGQLVAVGAMGAAAARTSVLYVVVPLNVLAMVTFPAISALKANHASADEQGQVQGALNGARGLASGVGPVLTAQLWRLLPDAPYIVYWVLCSFVLVALVLAATTLPRERALPARASLKQPLLGAAAAVGDGAAAASERGGGGSALVNGVEAEHSRISVMPIPCALVDTASAGLIDDVEGVSSA
jgi:DHA1 family tetracycline resistance protein-like MFS transporter